METILLITIKKGLSITQTPHCFHTEKEAMDYMKNYAAFVIKQLFPEELEKVINDEKNNCVTTDEKRLNELIVEYAKANINNIAVKENYIRISHGNWEHVYQIYDERAITLERAKELLNAMIHKTIRGDVLDNALKELIVTGFKPYELVSAFGFAYEDVKKAASKVDYREI